MTEFRYDGEHRLVASVDSDIHLASFSYDSIDRLRSVRTPGNERTTFTYVDSPIFTKPRRLGLNFKVQFRSAIPRVGHPFSSQAPSAHGLSLIWRNKKKAI